VIRSSKLAPDQGPAVTLRAVQQRGAQKTRTVSFLFVATILLVFTWPGFVGRAPAATDFHGTGARGKELVELRGLDTTRDDFFGSSVAISGTTIIVGSPGVASDTGRAYVFMKASGSWRQVAALRGPGSNPDDLFGSSVAISGTTAVVGSPGVASGTGRAYVFMKTARSWRQVAELRGPGTAAGDGFGSSVAVSQNTIIVGAPDHANRSGRAYVFAASRTGWGHAVELKGRDTVAGDEFGVAVAISSMRIVVGAPAHGAAAGRAYVFIRTAGGWGQAAELEGSDTVAGDIFGWSVAVSGTNIVVGAHGHSVSGPGRAYVFASSPTGWRQVAELAGSDTVADDTFSGPVAISGGTIAAGAPVHALSAGRAYVFTKAAGGWRQIAELKEPAAAPSDAFGASLAVSGTTIVVGAPGHGSGSAYVTQA
jgi:hypothetical protein